MKLTVFLGRLRTTNAPHELLAAQDSKLIAIARRLPSGEIELLRLAYSVIMGD
ncbi:MAG: hypothetical protein HC890_06580 [Chloroflexaceae bacterium]|nr:hypothetical protein [Chloroflexaceae bacterium]